jgi:hypothetical protein
MLTTAIAVLATAACAESEHSRPTSPLHDGEPIRIGVTALTEGTAEEVVALSRAGSLAECTTDSADYAEPSLPVVIPIEQVLRRDEDPPSTRELSARHSVGRAGGIRQVREVSSAEAATRDAILAALDTGDEREAERLLRAAQEESQ